ncbi:MAG: ABC transporter substrate-binding protein [Candidatus Poribacteria bacterium]|nr:MAG: ABC transporter substrate-binding protein [Candidatus Poribacteria bacterium]
MTRWETLRRSLVGIVVLSLWIAGCGGSDQEARESPALEKVFVFGRAADSVGLDPAHEEDGESFKVAELIFDTLVEYQPETTEVQPGLAQEWSSSEDGLVWRFRLRSGVQFHDGTPVDANAVVFSFARQFRADHPYHNVGGPWLYWTSLGLNEIIEDVVAVDPLTVEIRLKHPYAPLLNMLAIPSFAIVSPAALERWGEDFKTHPVGSGPFRFVEWRRDDRIVLERNEQFWGGRPPLDRIVFRVIPDPATRLLEIQQGNIHLMEFPDPENLEEIRNDPNLRLVQRPGMNIGYIAMNMERAPLDDVRIRYAINHAINKEQIVQALYQGLAVPAKNPIPPTLWGYNDAIEDFSYDPERARALIREVFPDGFPRTLSFYVLSNPRPYFLNPHNIGLAVQSDLERVGIPTRIETYDWGTYLEKVKMGEHDLAMLGWIADYADPDNFFWFLLAAPNATKPASNIAFYRNEEVTRLLREAQREADQERRAELYRRVQELVREDAPWVCVAHAQTVAVVRKEVQNFTLHPTSWRHLWRADLQVAKE